MDKKKILIIAGVGLLVVGAGIYFWKRSKKSAEAGGEAGATGGATGGTTPTSDAKLKSAETTTEASVEAVKKSLTTRKEKRKACGRKPILKKKRAEWQKCVDAGGSAFEGDYEDGYYNVISENFDLFDGDFDAMQNEYIDFDGEEEQLQSIYSDFDNNLDLDI